MAEVMLGTVASAAGLAGLTIQLLESGKKLKAFYDDIKDAPEDLKHLQEHLNTLAMLLQTIRNSENMTQLLIHSPHSEQCMASCEVAANEVTLFATRLEKGMAKNKRWGAIKSVLKKDCFEKLDKRLDKAISLLHLCCSLHGIELILQAVQSLQVRVQMPQPATMTDLIVPTPSSSRISSPLVSQSSFDGQDESDVEEIPRTFDYNRSRTSAIIRKKKTRFRLPFFFFNKIWDFQYRHSVSGWDVKLTARRIVPCDSEILTRARNADLEGVKALLVTNQASIFDEDEYGYNTINSCFRAYDAQRMFEYFQFFIDQGLVGDSINYNWGTHLPANPDHPVLHDLYRRVVPYLTESTVMQWLLCPGHPELIRGIAVQLDPPLHTYTLKHRLEVMLCADWLYQHGTRHVTDAFMTRLGCQITDDSFLRIIFLDDPSLLGRVVHVFGIAFAFGDEKGRGRLIDLFRTATEAGLIYWMYHTSYGSMLMHQFVMGIVERDIFDYGQLQSKSIETAPRDDLRMWEDPSLWNDMVHYEKLIFSAIRSWLDCLSVAGVRVTDYGRQVCTSIYPLPNNPDPLPGVPTSDWAFPEMAELELHNYEITAPWRDQPYPVYPFDQCKVITYHCGSHSEDWTVDFSWRLSDNSVWEKAAGRFWEMLDQSERPWQQIPGTWQYEWDTYDEVDDIRWPSYYTSRHRSWGGSAPPNRGWRKATARRVTNEECTRDTMISPKQSLRRHQRRLQRGAIWAAIEIGWWKDGGADAARYSRADEIEAYREAAGW